MFVLRSLRQFSTTAAPKGNSTLVYALGAAALGGGAYYYYTSTQPPVPSLVKDEFVNFKLKKVIDLTPNTKKFVFELPSANHVLGLNVASLVLAKLVGADGKDIVRPYTPTSPVDQKGTFDLIIKIYEKGKVKNNKGAFGQAISKLQPGQDLAVKFEYKANEFENIAMVAGGSGVTPMLQVAQHVLANPADKTKLTLIFGNVTEQDIICRSELDKLVAAHPSRFTVKYILDKPPAGWTGLSGYITKDILKDILPEPSEKNRILVCGPPGMMNAISGGKAKDYTQGELSGLLAKLGYKKEQVFKY